MLPGEQSPVNNDGHDEPLSSNGTPHTNDQPRLESVLQPQHIEQCRKSGLRDETILGAGLYTLTDRDRISQLLGWVGSHDFDACLVIPFFDAQGNPTNFSRLKPDRPRTKNGKLVKYEAALASGNRLYIPPHTRSVLGDVTVPLCITEGEKKCLAADQAGFAVVGLSGVENWSKARDTDVLGRKNGKRELIDDIAAVPMQARHIYICYDNDGLPNPNVRKAQAALAAALTERGAVVAIVTLPPGPPDEIGTPSKCGLDDFLLTHTPDELRGLIATAVAAEAPPKKAKPTAGVVSKRTGKLPYPPHYYPCSDYGNAERLVAQHGNDLRYCYPAKQWHAWDGTRWRADDTGEVERRAKATVRSIFGEAGEAKESKDKEALATHWLKSEHQQRINAMSSLARSQPGIPALPADLDKDPMLFNCLNGTIDLRTGELRPHRREDLLTKLAPVTYDASAQCPLWLRFLERVTEGKPDLVGYLQRITGYGLTGLSSEQELYFLYGTGANGKSTYLNTLRGLMGDYGLMSVPELLMVKQSQTHPTERADLAGRRFVVAIETDDGKRLAEALLKSLTGGENIRARYLFQNFFEFSPTFKILLAGNYKPVIRGADPAIWRRIRLISFDVAIPPAEKDKHLMTKLRAEWAGILNWALRGCLDWQRDGMQTPGVVNERTTEYAKEQDTVTQFLDSCCLELAGAKVQVGVLFAAYQKWSGDQETKRQTFSKRLEAKGFRNDLGYANYYFWQDLALINDGSKEPKS
jgi:putative DNA primase/helicase